MITMEAVYEKGALWLTDPLPLDEKVKVQVTIHTESNWAQRTAGLMGWKGDAATVERFALDTEFEPEGEE